VQIVTLVCIGYGTGVATMESEDNRWNDNALCLPPYSNIELVWSYCGGIAQMDCIQLNDPAAPG
jgi:hypothetical protein